MNFLYPGFLFALLAVAIPIVIHLFNFRKFKKVYFSNVQFLKEVEAQSSSRTQLKHYLILACRILSVVFLVLAFARPYFPSAGAIDAKLNTVVGIYIDNSYSMEAVNKEGSLLDEAKRRAKELVKGFGVNDRFQLTTNDFEGRHQRAVSAAEFIKLLDEVKISSATRNLQQVVNRQSDAGSTGNNRFNYIISDFQESFSGHDQIESNREIRTSLVKLHANVLPNVAIDSVWFLSPLHKVDETERLVVQLKNYTGQEAKGIPVKLVLNGKERAVRTLDIPAFGSVKDTLLFSNLQPGWQEGQLSLNDFPVTFDDQLFFTFEVAAHMNVLSIDGKESGPYIKSLFSADAYFSLTQMPESNIRYTTFSSFPLIVLNGLITPSSGLAQELSTYLKNGGTVVVFPDLDGDQNLYTSFLKTLGLPAVSKLTTAPVMVNAIDLKHEVFKNVFEELPKTIDLPKVNRYFEYAEQQKADQLNILQLPLKKLFFAQFSAWTGKVFLCATSLNVKDSNLPMHPVFVPLLYKIAFGSVGTRSLYYTLGKDELLQSNKITLNANQSLKLSGNGIDAIPELRQQPGNTLLYIADQVKQPGFYKLKKAAATLAVFAFNTSRAESDMKYASAQTLKNLFPKQDVAFYDTKSDSLATATAAKNNSTELWKLCLILCAVFLGLEILLIRFYNKTKTISNS